MSRDKYRIRINKTYYTVSQIKEMFNENQTNGTIHTTTRRGKRKNN